MTEYGGKSQTAGGFSYEKDNETYCNSGRDL